jgi:hypothetical protein
LALQPGPDDYLTEVRAVDSGSVLQKFLFRPAAMHSEKQLLITRGEPGGWNLHSMRNGSLLVAYAGGESKSSLAPVFSRDGRWLAWGNEDGTVSVCELASLEQRMHSLGVGWKK